MILMRVRNQRGEQIVGWLAEALHLRHGGFGMFWRHVERHADIQHDTLSLGFDFDTSAANLFGTTMNANAHEAP